MKKTNLILLLIAINAFAIGLTEFISVGLIPMFVRDFNITEATASLSVTFYAVGVIIGAPLLSVLTNRINRKNVLILVMVIFITGNFIVLSAQTFTVLIAGRFISAFAHGLFMTAASTIAAELVSEEKKASAIAIMFTGLTVATIFGVPIGTCFALFFSWQTTFMLITLLGVIILIANILFIPKNIKNPEPVKITEQFQVFKAPKVLVIFLITALAYGSTFIVYTFISPFLLNVGFSAGAVTIILFIYGVMVAIGNTIGGKVTNKNTLTNLSKIIFIQAVIFVLVSLTLNFKYLLLISLILMGLFAFMNVPGLQLIALKRAQKYSPRAIDMATALNISAFNLGIAFGSYLGGLIIEYSQSSLTAVTAAIVAIISVWIIQLTKEENE